jgi:hypothetical protein
MTVHICISIQTVLLKYLLAAIRVFLDITLQAWHPCIWVLPFFSADIFKLSQVGWGALLHSYSGKKTYLNPLELPGFLHKMVIKFDLIFRTFTTLECA